MRKRLSVATAAMIFACAISPVAVWAEEPATSETVVTTEEITELDLDEQDVPAVCSAPSTPTTTGATVATVGEQSYDSLQAAIDAANGQDIVLQSDVALTTGLKFSGTADAPIDQWKTFTIDAKGHKITMEGKGIEATFCNVVIQNCPELTIHASVTPGVLDAATIAACFFGHATLTLDNCPKVTIENDRPEGEGGSGLCVYNEGSLYFQKNTNVTISGYMFSTRDADGDLVGASGIYMDCDDKDRKAPIGSINVTDHSTLTATHCFHNGITANPANINVKGNSVLKTCDNNTAESDGKGGLGCYFGKLTVADNSSVVSTGNTGWGYGIFVGGLEVDGTSEVNASNNGSLYHYDPDNQYADFWDGTGLAISGDAVLHSGAKVTANNNWGIGVMLYSDNDPESYPGGPLTIESGATLTACNNANYGMANAYTLTVKSGAHVYIKENLKGGLDNYPNATTIVEKDADFVISNNFGRGIKNGNAGQTELPAKLVIDSGVIAENHTEGKMPSFPDIDLSKFPDGYYYWGGGDYYNIGGGIYNECGIVSLSTAAKVYNNHAKDAGDDLYNDTTTGNSFTITQLVPGAKWSVLDDDQKIIDDWYKDEAGADKRWRVDNAINNTDIELPPSAALKAAHGKVAPTPSPSPTPDPTATPVPTNEPSPVPSASPVPSTPMPSAVPTAAPVAPVTRVDATATPAPTDAPTQQPTATIPQTGDAAPLALFGGLTISSAAAFYFLRKRRKSE